MLSSSASACQERKSMRHQRLGSVCSPASLALPRCFTLSASSRIDCCVMIFPSPGARELPPCQQPPESRRGRARSSHSDKASYSASSSRVSGLAHAFAPQPAHIHFVWMAACCATRMTRRCYLPHQPNRPGLACPCPRSLSKHRAPRGHLPASVTRWSRSLSIPDRRGSIRCGHAQAQSARKSRSRRVARALAASDG